MDYSTTVIVPSKGCTYIYYLLHGLSNQTKKPGEVVLVIRDCERNKIEKLCNSFKLTCTIIEQEKGYVTHALNMGKEAASGDILLFTDDDAIPLPRWIEKHLIAHRAYSQVACISSRDIYFDIYSRRLLPIPDDMPRIKLYRWFGVLWIKPPHPLLRKYIMGVYITRRFEIAHGPGIPSRLCYSLPFRGVNMSFKKKLVEDVWFPEHPELKRAIGYEQHLGLQCLLKGYDSVYVPDNPILHIVRESLSRVSNRKAKSEILREKKIMAELYKELLWSIEYEA